MVPSFMTVKSGFRSMTINLKAVTLISFSISSVMNCGLVSDARFESKGFHTSHRNNAVI